MVEVEHATKPLTPLHSTTMAVNNCSGAADQSIADSLVIPFAMVVRHIFRQRALKR